MRRSNMGSLGNRNNRNQRARGMRKGGTQRYIASKLASLLYVIVGVALAFPEVMDIMLGHEHHFISFFQLLMIFGLVIGGPLCLFGIIMLLCRNAGRHTGSLSDSDLARIRYAEETQARKNI